jgi:hypothetical protein
MDISAGCGCRIDGILNSEKYLDILENEILPAVTQLLGDSK